MYILASVRAWWPRRTGFSPSPPSTRRVQSNESIHPRIPRRILANVFSAKLCNRVAQVWLFWEKVCLLGLLPSRLWLRRCQHGWGKWKYWKGEAKMLQLGNWLSANPNANVADLPHNLRPVRGLYSECSTSSCDSEEGAPFNQNNYKKNMNGMLSEVD